jgi:PIN domain nuclease of toxin-antitoxin system
MFVTDTHALIWFTQPGRSRLGKRSRSLFEKAENELTVIYVPTVVLWEIADHARQGTIEIPQRFDHWCRSLQSKAGFILHPLLWEDVNEARTLPFADPFDRLIVGTALRLDLPLITKDAEIRASNLLETIW